jgi:predicted ester cyclase
MAAITVDSKNTQGGNPMSAETNKALVRRFVEQIISEGNLAVADELIATNYIYYGPGMEVSGPDGIKQLFTMLRGAFPNWYETIEDLIAEGDKVVFRVTGHGTHQGEFMGIPPTGRQVTVKGIDIVSITAGQIVEHWANFDQLGMLQQLGVIPAPEQTG